MIRIRRGREPRKLREVRKAELNRVRPLHAAGTLTRDDLGNQYTTVINELWRAQFLMCCYCEMQQLQVWNDLEHFRPAGNARRDSHNDSGYGGWRGRGRISCSPAASVTEPQRTTGFPCTLAARRYSQRNIRPETSQRC